MKPIIVTGAAGFIGFYVSKQLIESGHEVVGIDNLNDYYDPSLKEARLAQLHTHPNFRFLKQDVSDYDRLFSLTKSIKPTRFIHLAAQAGVRYSKENPRVYATSNLDGFLNVLEVCRHLEVEHLVYSSSSSVYGVDAQLPLVESAAVDKPASFYAATKRANELMAFSYSHLYGLPTSGLRFFTVYGPWGRPDMAPILFTKAMLAGETIKLFGEGRPIRDFTFATDISEAVVRMMEAIPSSGGSAPHQIVNVGNGSPITVVEFVRALENALGVKANVELVGMQSGDMEATLADTTLLHTLTGFRPNTSIETGLSRLASWYREYFK